MSNYSEMEIFILMSIIRQKYADERIKLFTTSMYFGIHNNLEYGK